MARTIFYIIDVSDFGNIGSQAVVCHIQRMCETLKIMFDMSILTNVSALLTQSKLLQFSRRACEVEFDHIV